MQEICEGGEEQTQSTESSVTAQLFPGCTAALCQHGSDDCTNSGDIYTITQQTQNSCHSKCFSFLRAHPPFLFPPIKYENDSNNFENTNLSHIKS